MTPSQLGSRLCVCVCCVIRLYSEALPCCNPALILQTGGLYATGGRCDLPYGRASFCWPLHSWLSCTLDPVPWWPRDKSLCGAYSKSLASSQSRPERRRQSAAHSVRAKQVHWQLFIKYLCLDQLAKWKLIRNGTQPHYSITCFRKLRL